MPAQCLLGRFIVFHAQAEQWLPGRLGNERIKIINVQLRFEQCRHETIQVGGLNLDDDQIAFSIGKVLAQEQVPSAIGIIYNDTDDGTVGRVENHQTQDVNALGIQHANQVMEPAQSVGREDRKLDDRIRAPCFRCRCCHIY